MAAFAFPGSLALLGEGVTDGCDARFLHSSSSLLLGFRHLTTESWKRLRFRSCAAMQETSQRGGQEVKLSRGRNKGTGRLLARSGICARPLKAQNSNGATEPSDLVVCFGEMLIDFVPTVNGVSLAEAPAFQKAPGGAPANVAVGISRLGGRSAFVGKVGDDEFGHMLADILRTNNVDTRGVRFDGGARTALAFVTLRSDGEREFMFYRNPSADMLLQPEELNLELISQARIAHYGSISLIAEPCRSAHVAFMDAARASGALLSYDPNLRLPLWSSADEARTEIRSIWNQAQVIKVSEEEITFLTEGGDPYSDEAARALFHDNLVALLVTEGSAGCRYYTQEFQGRVPGFKVEAVDTTGAGDAFVAGFLKKLAEDRSQLKDEGKLRETLQFANACGALATTERGAIPALPTPAKVETLLTKIAV